MDHANKPKTRPFTSVRAVMRRAANAGDLVNACTALSKLKYHNVSSAAS